MLGPRLFSPCVNVKGRFNGSRTLEMLKKCFRNDFLKKTVIDQWHGWFKSGLDSIESDERSGEPSTSKTIENIDKEKRNVGQ